MVGMNKPLHPCVEALMALAYGEGEECRWCHRFAGLDHASECPIVLMAAGLAAVATSAPVSGAEQLDVERLARAMEDVFPGWLEEAPGTAEAQAEMRAYAEQLDKAYRWLADSASPPVPAPDTGAEERLRAAAQAVVTAFDEKDSEFVLDIEVLRSALSGGSVDEEGKERA